MVNGSKPCFPLKFIRAYNYEGHQPSRHETAWEGTVHEVVYPNKTKHKGSNTF